MRRFADERYPLEVITEDQLRDEYQGPDFDRHINNCLVENNGTLTEIKELKPLKSYRLFTAAVQHGITDFGDEKYIILTEKVSANHRIALIHDDHQFIVAYGFQTHEYDSIDWVQGHYYTALEPAFSKFRSYKEDENVAPFYAELVNLFLDNGHDADDANVIADAVVDVVEDWMPMIGDQMK